MGCCILHSCTGTDVVDDYCLSTKIAKSLRFERRSHCLRTIQLAYNTIQVPSVCHHVMWPPPSTISVSVLANHTTISTLLLKNYFELGIKWEMSNQKYVWAHLVLSGLWWGLIKSIRKGSIKLCKRGGEVLNIFP